MSKKIIGVDIGATKIHAGVVDGAEVKKEVRFQTLANAPKEEIISNLIKGIEAVNDQDVCGIGIGVPGLVDEERGIIYDLLNIPSWKEVHLKEQLEAHFNKPVRITNDANVFALGEKIFGKGKAFKNLVGITLGTGFGAGIIINDNLYSGTLSSAGEIGIVRYQDKSIEDYCSGKFFIREFNLDGNEVFRRAKMGDKSALQIMDEFGQHLGNALKVVMNILSPEAIFLGGSISKSFPYFESSLRKEINSFPFKKVLEQLVIEPSDIDNISILGSAGLLVAEFPDLEESSNNANRLIS